MIVCPQCGSAIPDDSRSCPCCKKTFLTIPTSGVRRRAQKPVETGLIRDPTAPPPGELAAKVWAARIWIGLAALAVAMLIGTAWLRQRNLLPENPWIDARGLGQLAPVTLSEDLSDVVTIVDQQLAASPRDVRVRGEVTNKSSRALLGARVVTVFQYSDGKEAGTATGSLGHVGPGETREYSTEGALALTPRQAAGLRWITSLQDVRWAERAAAKP